MKSVKTIREERGFTQKMLSEMTGIARSYICEIEQDRKQPTLRTLEKIANALNISTDELLRRENWSKTVVTKNT